MARRRQTGNIQGSIWSETPHADRIEADPRPGGGYASYLIGFELITDNRNPDDNNDGVPDGANIGGQNQAGPAHRYLAAPQLPGTDVWRVVRVLVDQSPGGSECGRDSQIGVVLGLKVGTEQVPQAGSRFVVSLGVVPGATRIEDCVIHTVAGGGDRQAKNR